MARTATGIEVRHVAVHVTGCALLEALAPAVSPLQPQTIRQFRRRFGVRVPKPGSPDHRPSAHTLSLTLPGHRSCRRQLKAAKALLARESLARDEGLPSLLGIGTAFSAGIPAAG